MFVREFHIQYDLLWPWEPTLKVMRQVSVRCMSIL